jgi:hypothetical protein
VSRTGTEPTIIEAIRSDLSTTATWLLDRGGQPTLMNLRRVINHCKSHTRRKILRRYRKPASATARTSPSMGEKAPHARCQMAVHKAAHVSADQLRLRAAGSPR